MLRKTTIGENLATSVFAPAVLITAIVVPCLFAIWKADFESRAAPIRREIAQNFAEKWGRCDIAVKWDKNVPSCKEH